MKDSNAHLRSLKIAATYPIETNEDYATTLAA
jgi:hypothetical protein